MTTTRALTGAILSLILAEPAAAGAQGWYLSLEGGAGAVGDWDHTRTKWTYCGPEIKDAVAVFDNGWAAFGAAGYALGQWRIEAEGGFQQNGVESYVKEKWRGKTWAVPDVGGELTEASLMINVIYDVPIFERFSLAIGLGAGGDYARFELDTPWTPVNEEDWHFSYHGIAGLNYALTQLTVVFVNYRFANVRDIRFQPTDVVELAGDDFQKHAATAGVRFALSAPASPPPAPPPATPAPVPLEREFMVFFGFNRWSLSPQALATIKDAAGSVRASGSAAIRVIGHADRAGSIAYNKALSLRRAKSVEKALISEGVAGEAISISGRGESEPMVPTADGVRESQNRRVHISF
jgi:OOP family OmpA-OmpF porin